MAVRSSAAAENLPGRSCPARRARIVSSSPSPWEGSTLANTLVAGLGDLDSARTAVDLRRLARLAGAEPALKAALLEAARRSDPRTVAAALAESGEPIVRGWDAFLEEHGHHARGEIELYTPRRREDPGHLLMFLAGYLRTEGEDDMTVRTWAGCSVTAASSRANTAYPPW